MHVNVSDAWSSVAQLLKYQSASKLPGGGYSFKLHISSTLSLGQDIGPRSLQFNKYAIVLQVVLRSL